MQDATGVTVLLVEDDQDNRELMSEVLEAAGFTVVAAGDGREALRRLGERVIGVVVTDVGMPGVGGLEVARAAKRIGPIPVVIVTGYTEREDIATALGRREIDHVLVKPADPEALVAAVMAVLGGDGA